MTKATGSSSLQLLDLLVSVWSTGRGCKIGPLSSNGSPSTFATSRPGFLYCWNESHEPVKITFLAEGSHRFSQENGHALFIGAGRGDLALQIPDLPQHLIKAEDPIDARQLQEIIGDARNSIRSPQPDCRDELTTITSAQRLAALGYDARNGSNGGDKSEKLSAKSRFVDDLHAWLAEHIKDSVKLGDAASQLGKSPRQLTRILKDTSGAGFAEHLTMHRLTLARTSLMRSDESVMEVGRKSGFNSREQFIRSFNKAFGWTPLQFRKAWNRASLAQGELDSLCRASERSEVNWQEPGQLANGPTNPENCTPHTLVVTNAVHEIVELFSIDPAGRPSRVNVLDRGAMVFIGRDFENSSWLVRTLTGSFERSFTTPANHCIATINPTLGGKKKGRR
ncbi:helix-turn-helix transcriptional regulator [Haloferula sp.]|uniref:helix-turn-helix transcriptional regulator n=1 Tax=Haloferula sp. TaxID=2497595 RepID=UPI003C75C6CD